MQSQTFVGARIDTAICNLDWSMTFPNATVFHLLRMQSDHCPILLKLDTMDNRRASIKRFLFQTAWFAHPNFMEWFRSNCGADSSGMWAKIKFFTNKVQEWSLTVFRDLNKCKH